VDGGPVIPFDRWHDNGDGTAWMVVTLPVSAAMQHFDRPCDCNCHDSAGPDVVEECDCIDGRHTFTVEVEHAANGCQIGSCRDQDSDLRYGVHRLRVSIIPGMVIPIIDPGPCSPEVIPCIELWTKGTSAGDAWLWLDDQQRHALSVNLPDGKRVGMYAVKVKVQ
jgi:hypothetical protein